jgi:peptidoglycan/xylan/chitin deacetylase (PgdA/CDA1 family)
MGTLKKPYALVRLNRPLLLGLLAILSLLGALAAMTARAVSVPEGVDLPVVMYHAVLKDEARHGQYVISPAELENDLLYLKRQGYTTILAQDLIAYTQGADLPEKPILITFDDGYYNNYLYAFELAKKYHCKFVLSPIGRWADFYSETGETNAYYTHATWDQLKEMADSGLVEIQNHSYDLHRTSGPVGVQRRQGESGVQYRARLTADVMKAQQVIEDHLGQAPAVFVYPFGAVSQGTMEIIRGLGFSATFSCRERINRVTRDPESLYDLGRFLRPSGVSSQTFFEQQMKLS